MTQTKRDAQSTARINDRLISACLQQLFTDGDPALIEAVRANADVVSIRRGELLFKQGAEGHELYLLVRGRLRMTVKADDGEVLVSAEVPRFQTIGEIALFTEHDRMSTLIIFIISCVRH